jgi:hypothetical protein
MLPRGVIALLGALAGAGTPVPARAAETAERVSRPSSDARTERRWYGYQILAIDTLAVTAVLVDGAADWGGAAAIPAYFVYVVAPPSVHSLAHGREGAALGSLGLRLALPIGGAVVAAETCDGGECVASATTGLVLGAALATFIDAGLLAWKDVQIRPLASISPSGVSGALALSF